MKQITVVFRAVLLVAVLASLAACSGGTFVDPGYGGGGDSGYSSGGGGGSGDDDDGGGGNSGNATKPSTLSTSATYAQVMAKLDEIIAYCNATEPTNNGFRGAAQTYKTQLTSGGSAAWTLSMASTMIPLINGIISTLV
jgi:hypothetical protein